VSITATCPKCGKSGQVPEAAAGKNARCKTCQTVFRVAAEAKGRSLTDAQMVRVLTELAKAYDSNDAVAMTRLEPTATEIGEALNARGRHRRNATHLRAHPADTR
jgi:hypothetical protein